MTTIQVEDVEQYEDKLARWRGRYEGVLALAELLHSLKIKAADDFRSCFVYKFEDDWAICYLCATERCNCSCDDRYDRNEDYEPDDDIHDSSSPGMFETGTPPVQGKSNKL